MRFALIQVDTALVARPAQVLVHVHLISHSDPSRRHVFRVIYVPDECFSSPNLRRSVSNTMGVGQSKRSSRSPSCSLVF